MNVRKTMHFVEHTFTSDHKCLQRMVDNLENYGMHAVVSYWLLANSYQIANLTVQIILGEFSANKIESTESLKNTCQVPKPYSKPTRQTILTKSL